MWAVVLLVGANAAVRRGGDGPHSVTVGESGYSSMSDSLPPLSPLSKHEPFAFTRRDAPGTVPAPVAEPKHSPINPGATVQAFRAQVKTGLTDGQVLGFLRLGGAHAYRELLARVKAAVEAAVGGTCDPEAVLAPYDDFDPQDFETLEAFAEHLAAGAPARARQHQEDDLEGRKARAKAAKVALVALLDALMPVEVAELPASVQAIVASRLQTLLSGYGWDAGGSGPASEDPSLVKAATRMAQDLRGYQSAGGCPDAGSYELAVRMLKNANWDLQRANQQYQSLHAGWEYATGPRRMAEEAGARWRARRQRGSQ